MAKSKEELNALKEELGKMNEKLSQLSEDELKEVSGGAAGLQRCPKCGSLMIATYRPMPGAPGVTYRVFVCQNPYCKFEVRM